MPQKLPRYVFRRANGSYRYKRNVPNRLRHLIGKDTLYRQPDQSYSEAIFPRYALEVMREHMERVWIIGL